MVTERDASVASTGTAANSGSSSASDSVQPSPVQTAPIQPSPATIRAFVKALKAGDTAKVLELLDESAELIERRGMWENTPLLVACHYGHESTALALLERGACPSAVNEQGCTPLLYACVEGMGEATARLMDDAATELSPSPASVYSRLTDETALRTPLLAAAENGFTDGVDL